MATRDKSVSPQARAPSKSPALVPKRLPTLQLDVIGIAPEIRIPSTETDVIGYAARYLRAHRDGSVQNDID